MAVAGNCYKVMLTDTHISWGTYRYTPSRDKILGETFIPIPRKYAKLYQIFNSNKLNMDQIGVNLFYFNAFIDNDIYLSGTLKAQGCSSSGDIYAKNFSGNNDLKLLSPWIHAAGISVGDYVEIRFISSVKIEIRKLP